MPLPEDSIGYRIRRARMWRGMGQATLARAIGVSPNALSQIEQAVRKHHGAILSRRLRGNYVSVQISCCV